MVAVDGIHNDWRSLVLPLAYQNELLMNAVLTVSSSHISINKYSTLQPPLEILARLREEPAFYLPNPNEIYKRVISGLRQHSSFGQYDYLAKHSVMITILVLLVGVLVTGQSDFTMLVRMMESALEAGGGEEYLGTGQAVDFIVPQIHKYDSSFDYRANVNGGTGFGFMPPPF